LEVLIPATQPRLVGGVPGRPEACSCARAFPRSVIPGDGMAGGSTKATTMLFEDSRRNPGSNIVPITVKPGDHDGPAAPPSPAAATLTAEPPRAQGSAPAGDAPAGSQLRDPGRYDILGEHGRGGLGRVSRARDRDLGHDVAIKEL